MSLVSLIIEDDDNHSLSSLTNSDDDIVEFDCHTHRSCSRYAACNKQTHQHSLTESLPKTFKAIKGDIRSVDNEPGHRQKYDGLKWRRICSNTDCLIYLNGGVFHKNWLCRKHYLLRFSTDPITTSDRSIINNIELVLSTSKTSEKLCTRPSNKKLKHHKRGDLMIDTDGNRQKYNGKIWRRVCLHDNCQSFAVAHGYCHRHNMEIRKKTCEILSSLDDIPPSNSTPTDGSISSTAEKPQKGDIQLVRQQWNGTKWYSLCNYHTKDCTRRSNGIKCRYLCDVHYKEYLEKQKDQSVTNRILLSPRVKRKKSITYDDPHISNNIDTEPYQCQSTIEERKLTEQSIQTDVTCPLESEDLRQGCILVEDNSNDLYQCDSPQVMVYIKKEEENYVNNKRKLSIDVNSLPLDCKLELTKLEF